MARSGTRTRVKAESSEGGAAATRQALVDAAIEGLQQEGFAGASARTIAARAGCNQGLVFYHFGSMANLLLAALDEISGRRLREYEQALEDVHSFAELVPVAAAIFKEDLDKGYVTVLAEMIAGASSTPGLAEEVAKRIKPWRTFASTAIERAVSGSALDGAVPAQTVGHAVVALYLGLELLAHLDGDRRPADALFKQAATLAPVMEMLRS